MEETLTILHLSDAHVGSPVDHFKAGGVFHDLFADLSKTTKHFSLAPDVIVFSGDLIYGRATGAPDIRTQFQEASEFLHGIYNGLDKPFLSVPLLIVPGNHDLDRHMITRDQTSWVRRDAHKDLKYLDQIMQNGERHWNLLRDRQGEWTSFIESLNLPWTFDRNLNMSCGTLSIAGRRIGFAGMNSSWSAADDEDEAQLLLGEHQLHKAKLELSDADFRIAVMHHPTNWFHESEKHHVTQALQTQYDLYLHGHDHEAWALDSAGHLKVSAGACYERKDHNRGYSWIRVRFQQRIAEVILREHSDKSGWRPNVIPRSTTEGVYTAKALFENSSAQVAPQTPSQLVQISSGNGRVRPRVCTLLKSGLGKREQLNDISKLIFELHDEFGFTWEEFDFTLGIGDVLVYWPVRLRPPTPIHAVQSFVAAALQKAGAAVVLCVDDLGNVDGQNEFDLRINKWFGAVGGDVSKLNSQSLRFSDVLTKKRANDVWQLVQTWLGKTKWRLDKVLTVSKLLGVSVSSLDNLLQKRPRRLLTPALVWACLLHVYDSNPDKRILTLGGNDERPLWNAWRDLAKIPKAKVGHLYAPELREAQQDGTGSAIHMSKTDLGWSARQDIERTLLSDLNPGSGAEGNGDSTSLNRLFGWCLNGCVCLPTFLNGNDCNLTLDGRPIICDELKNVESGLLAKAAAVWIDQWVL